MNPVHATRLARIGKHVSKQLYSALVRKDKDMIENAGWFFKVGPGRLARHVTEVTTGRTPKWTDISVRKFLKSSDDSDWVSPFKIQPLKEKVFTGAKFKPGDFPKPKQPKTYDFDKQVDDIIKERFG